jgi:hypothetical protein
MYIAQKLFDDSDTSTAENDFACASSKAIKIEEKTMENVNYSTFIFDDNSKFTLGSNGFVGCEIPN